jgi:hypothetical protein
MSDARASGFRFIAEPNDRLNRRQPERRTGGAPRATNGTFGRQKIVVPDAVEKAGRPGRRGGGSQGSHRQIQVNILILLQ